MARGDRPGHGHERTTEERERDRQERERRRAAREGAYADTADSAPPWVPQPASAAGRRGAAELTDALEHGAEDAGSPATPAGSAAANALAGEQPMELIEQPPHEAPVEAAPAIAHDALPEAAAVPEVLEPGRREPAVAQPPPPDPLLPEGGAAIGDSAQAPAGARGRLPPPPPVPPRGAVPQRGRGRGGLGGAGGRRSPRARLGAMLALAAAAVVVAIVLYALLRPGSSKPAAAPAVVKVLVPEGMTRAQIAEIAGKAGLRGSYRAASRRSPLLNPAHYGAPSSTRTLEGFLFPATYDEYRGAPASRLVGEQLTAFNENFGAAQIARARALHVTPYQLLTVASMVEREAQLPSDRAKIAAVIYNRLKAGMPLGIDATIYYAIEQEKGIATYTRELTESQLHLESPYNTRTHPGLPPTPISNPGLASIEAAANPARVNYLYYVLAPDGCGEHVFSTTSAGFEAADAAYKASIARNGGKPPACKKK